MAYDNDIIQNINIRTFESAANRQTIKRRWETAIEKGNSLTTEIQYFTEQPKLALRRKKVYQREMSSYIAAEVIMVGLVLYLRYTTQCFGNAFFWVFILSIQYYWNFGNGFRLSTVKKISIYSQSQFVYKNIENIGKAVLYSLHDLGYITTPLDEIKIRSEEIFLSGTICNIDGATRVESALFVKALQEILNPIENPRYLLEKSSLFKEITELQNYFAVPAIFGGKKKDVEIFLGNWRTYVGGARLHYTRTVEGRKLLIKARLFHVTNVF